LETLELLSRYNGYHSIKEYAWLLESLWANYQPGLGLELVLDQGLSQNLATKGFKLNQEEYDEALQLLIQCAELRSSRGLLASLGLGSGLGHYYSIRYFLRSTCMGSFQNGSSLVGGPLP
jgi:hypothetical protein